MNPKKQKEGVCKLCLEFKPLVGQSHILTNWLYDPLSVDQRQYYFMPVSNFINNNYDKKHPRETGEFEKYILCYACEAKFNKHENYFAIAKRGGELKVSECPYFNDFLLPNGIKVIYAHRIDYKKTKLFFLSNLWRASISKRRMFNEVSLNDEHEETIRKMLYNEDAGNEDQYPVIVNTYLHYKEGLHDILFQPVKGKYNGQIVYSMFICGMIYFIFINSETYPMPQFITENSITKKNELPIFLIPSHLVDQFVFNYINRNFGIVLPKYKAKNYLPFPFAVT